MAGTSDSDKLERTASQASTTSRRSGIVRARSRKHSLVTPDSAKTLESFPSLSPDISPGVKKSYGKLVSSPPPKSTSETPRESSKQEPSKLETLIHSTPSYRGRSALFEESPKGNGHDVPGALHLASDEHIRRLVKKTGSVALVKQLAEDLAQRDAEITAFRRRAEEREMELKKMLREVEVSNLNIERRLHRIDNSDDDGTTKRTSVKAEVSTNGDSKAKNGVSKITNDINQMVGEAMKDDVGALEIDEGYLDTLDSSNGHATVRARGVSAQELDGQSTASSIESHGQPRSTARGWKDYLWSGNTASRKTSKASSVTSDYGDETQAGLRTRGTNGGNNNRRKGLNDNLFQPPARASTVGNGVPELRSKKSSTSIASWTTKLFAGNPTAGREADTSGTVRSRSNTTGSEQTLASRSASTISGPPPRSARAALLKVNSTESTARQTKKSIQPLILGQKVGSKPSSIPPVPPLPTSPASVNAATNLGPVEMDTIHPPESKPPTLAQSNDKISDDLLTDRFGFIYDQRRRKKEAEAAVSHKRGKSNASANIQMITSTRASMKSPAPDHASQLSKPESLIRPDTPLSTEDVAEERPTKRWQDYLKVATFPTELLSHTPSAKPGTNVVSADAPSPSFQRTTTNTDARASLPSVSLNPEPEMSPVTAGKAELSKSLLSPSAEKSTSAAVEAEPVKLLLAQLTELHDTIQREKTVKWNEFLRKVRAERKKEGETASMTEGRSIQAAMPEVTLADGELIGVAGLGNKGKVGRAKWKEFKQLVLGGIPVTYRAKIWAECSGAYALRVPGYYDDLVRDATDDPVIVSQIQMDIHRTLTDNIFFRKGPGVSKLNEVLLAYSRRNPEIGYCQGMNLITASLLLIMPTAEDAFWVLTSMIENILPQHYYDHSLLASRADQQVLRDYVGEILPKLSAHLDELGIELEALTFQWFLSVFTDCLSAEALFRVWDVIFCFNDGSTFLFQVALALLKLNEGQLLECDTAARVYSYIGNEMTDHAISIDGLVQASEALKKVIRRVEVEERRRRATEEARGKEMRLRSVSASSVGSATELSMQEPTPFQDENSGRSAGKA
ncbi:MAG: hypothetical protein Q9164_006535 [Protoblastenia rupestris]